MNESNNKRNDQPKEEQKPADETQPKLREISKEELKQILEEHQKWVESDGKEGEQADLSNANLQKADLRKANLQRADLRKANLQEASLWEANLQKASLWRANLQEAFLRGANLQETDLLGANLKKAYFMEANLEGTILVGANLQEANLYNVDMRNTALGVVKGLSEANMQYTNLEGTIGLLGDEFAQADVTGTKLPNDIKEFKALETVKETSQNARKIFFAMLLGCVYSWLTIATTTDVRLLTNTASSPLPIIQTEIPIAWFYLVAPLVLICLYLYFHFYLQGLWEGLAGLPAKFPDGKRLDERAYPWLLNRLVRRHFKRLRTGRPIMAHLQEYVVIILSWCVVPFTMVGFWLRYIPRHDWFGTIFHILLIVLSVSFGIIFYRICALTLQGKRQNRFRIIKFWGDRRFCYSVGVVVVGIIFSLLSYGSINGVRHFYPMMPKIKFSIKNYVNIKEVVPWALKKIGYSVFADFGEKDISERPANYWEISERDRLNSVKGANLRNRNLKYALMHRAFLVKADLRNAELQNAILWLADLQNANLRDVKLRNAGLTDAGLQNAILTDADLQNAYLEDADLQNAVLFKADLQAANLKDANLKRANLGYADLQNAVLIKTDLTGAKNLTIEQLSKVKTLYQAKLDPELMEQVKKCCPHLLEKPK